ncbi:hypothetical protein SI859A1_03594 [Aurantimonas manganoxydans SI85-9A1]|uniref:Uncharacterized protein n=1 Tax=Aurantimonas manganoxydans (strain ATCC BAA-1229 / DSM 21871 / SI85-9A1) TaxID=287752 RepID=Q1YE24_AURMS|nr:hypothetical protein SI859A1_03594 [Aurantimonas manganoxydans SI85-9A1]
MKWLRFGMGPRVKPKQLCEYASRGGWARLIFSGSDCHVERDEELAGDGDQAELCWFAGGRHGGEEGLPRRCSHGGERRHVEGVAHALAATLDAASAAQQAGVPGNGGKPRQGGDRPAADAAEFGQAGQQHRSGDRSDAGSCAQHAALAGQSGIGRDRRLDAALDGADLRVEEGDHREVTSAMHGSLMVRNRTRSALRIATSWSRRLTKPCSASRAGATFSVGRSARAVP